MERSFVARNLRKCILYSDLIDQPSLDTEEKRVKAAQSASVLVDQPDVFDNSINTIIVKRKPAYIVSSIPKSIILRLLAKNIKHTYKLSIKSRDNIISTLIAFLKETSPYHIHRLDIKSFYESIDRSKIYGKLKSDGYLSRKNLFLINEFFTELDNKNIEGLPRGLSISAVLSELALKLVDETLSSEDGVFFYSRFVDDIIIITDTSLTKSHIFDIVTKSLPDKLELHKTGNKSYFGAATKSKQSNPLDKTSKFDYLGYDFTVYNVPCLTDNFLGMARRRVSIDISIGKTNKLKSRLIKSLIKYTNSKKTSDEYNLLLLRIKFLSGNYSLINASPSPNVKSGIYYNYSKINEYKQLESLDDLLKSLLFNKNSNLSIRIQRSIPISKRIDIAHFSFIKGFTRKTHHKFKFKDFERVKQAWL